MVNGDIELEIGEDAEPDAFSVKVLSSAAGGRPQGRLLLDIGDLLARHDRLENAVLASAVPQRRVMPAAEEPLQDVGQQLFDAVFTGEVRDAYRASLGAVQQAGERLRVVLHLTAPDLAALPWESMYDRQTGAYLCRTEPLIRHVDARYTPQPLRVHPPLRILGLVSSPKGLPRLDAHGEQQDLEQALAGPLAAGRVELTWAPDASWSSIHDLLLDGTWHIVHFIGHGDFDSVKDEGVFALEGPDGRADLVEASRLTDLLSEADPTPQLVVLNSCSSGQEGARDLFSGTAAALVHGGISAVAAMQFSISDDAALRFARGFYAAIARGKPVDEAVRSGRIEILGAARTLEWVTPVLYVRGGVTQLFKLTGPPSPRHGEGKRVKAQASEPQAPPPSAPGTSQAAPADLRTQARAEPHVQHYVPAPRVVKVGQWVACLAISADGTRLAAGTRQRIRMWDLRDGRLIREAYIGDWVDSVRSVAFSPDGTRLATASDDKTARVWDTATGTEQLRVTHNGAVNVVAFSPDGTRLATATGDRTAVWDAETGAERLQVTHDGLVKGVAFSPDGTRLATASDDKTARVWDTATGTEQLRVTHRRRVNGVAFSPDGTRLATSGYDKTARVWDTATGTEQLRVTYDHGVAGVVFSPDGTRLAGACGDKTVQITDAASGAGCHPRQDGER